MIFSELYSAYYNAVAAIIRSALDHPLSRDEIRSIIEAHAFGESTLTIEPALTEGRWQLLRPDGGSIICEKPDMPLTLIQKRWLKAISLDPRIRLFSDDLPDFPDVEPLFTPEDVTVFDKYSDGDDYEDEAYRRNFRLILDAIKCSYPIRIRMLNKQGVEVAKVLIPKYLEYSEKDDKFRMIASGRPIGGTYNLGRLRACERFKGEYDEEKMQQQPAKRCEVTFELIDERNALERALLHFSHFEKEAERLGGDRYRVTVRYDLGDETEIIIRILSFGPMIRVTGPNAFVNKIKERLIRQKSCGL